MFITNNNTYKLVNFNASLKNHILRKRSLSLITLKITKVRQMQNFSENFLLLFFLRFSSSPT